MLELILLLLAIWAVGVITAYTFGGFIHVLLIAAIVIVLAKLAKS